MDAVLGFQISYMQCRRLALRMQSRAPIGQHDADSSVVPFGFPGYLHIKKRGAPMQSAVLSKAFPELMGVISADQKRLITERLEVRLKVLFYVYPGLLAQGPDFNGGWTAVMARLARTLASTGAGEYVILTGSRFAHQAAPLPAQIKLRLIDDLVFHSAVREIAPLSSTPTALAKLARSACDQSHPAIALLANLIRTACDDFYPELIVTVSLEAKYLRSLWPNTPILNVEAGAFSRSPFPFSLYFDHVGMYQASATAMPLASSAEASLSFAKDFRVWTDNALAEADPFRQHDYRQSFERLALLPLQVSNYFSFDDQCNYRTQFEYVYDVLSAAPKSIGLIATEYVHWGDVFDASHSGTNLAFLRKTFPNLLVTPIARKYTSSSQYLCRHVDGVWSVSSNVGYQALLLGKRLGSPLGTHYQNVAHDHILGEFFSSLIASAPTQDRLPFLAWYLENYLVPETLFDNASWLHQYLSGRREAILSARDPLDGFIPIGCPSAIREAWDLNRSSGPAVRWESKEHHALRQLARKDAQLAVMESRGGREKARDDVHDDDCDSSYVVLSGSEPRDQSVSFGSNLVTRFIHDRLARIGLRHLDCPNTIEEPAAFLRMPDTAGVKLLVLDAEGCLIQSNERMRGLIQLASETTHHSARTVLLNANPCESDEVMSPVLRLFDAVTVRGPTTAERTRHWHDNAIFLSDFLFAAIRNYTATKPDAGRGDCTCQLMVMEGISRDAESALSEFAEFYQVPYYLMDDSSVARIITDQRTAFEIGDVVYPRMLRMPGELVGARACLTGNYQGLVTALTLGIPAICPPTDIPDIEALLGGVGVQFQSLLPLDWNRFGHLAKYAAVEAQLEEWTAVIRESTETWVNVAISQIEQFFAHLNGLVNGNASVTSSH
jgi:hypothetical protein